VISEEQAFEASRLDRARDVAGPHREIRCMDDDANPHAQAANL
jgi:hypothetical protein